MFWLFPFMTSFADDRTDTPAEKHYRESPAAEKELEKKQGEADLPPWSNEPRAEPREESVHDALVEGVKDAGKEVADAVDGK